MSYEVFTTGPKFLAKHVDAEGVIRTATLDSEEEAVAWAEALEAPAPKKKAKKKA